jgi:hypothetical protein
MKLSLFSHKKNENLSFAGKWMELESIILSEIREAQKAKRYCLLYVEDRPNTSAAKL